MTSDYFLRTRHHFFITFQFSGHEGLYDRN